MFQKRYPLSLPWSAKKFKSTVTKASKLCSPDTLKSKKLSKMLLFMRRLRATAAKLTLFEAYATCALSAQTPISARSARKTVSIRSILYSKSESRSKPLQNLFASSKIQKGWLQKQRPKLKLKSPPKPIFTPGNVVLKTPKLLHATLHAS